MKKMFDQYKKNIFSIRYISHISYIFKYYTNYLKSLAVTKNYFVKKDTNNCFHQKLLSSLELSSSVQSEFSSSEEMSMPSVTYSGIFFSFYLTTYFCSSKNT